MSMIDTYAERLLQRDADVELAELAALQLENDFKSLLSQAAGRRVFQSLLAHCGTDAASFSPNQADITAFKEGRRDVGLWLTTHLQAHPALYLTFIQEALYGSSESDSNSGN